MKNEVVELIKGNLLEIIPELSKETISLDDSFVDLGANSIDRGELIMLTLERMELNVPRIEFVSAQTINQLADLILEKRLS
ncbi:MAG: phosphopantetheine-binding protein [Chitinophagaceae bacterium]